MDTRHGKVNLASWGWVVCCPCGQKLLALCFGPGHSSQVWFRGTLRTSASLLWRNRCARARVWCALRSNLCMELWLLSCNWFRHGLRHLDYNYTDGPHFNIWCGIQLHAKTRVPVCTWGLSVYTPFILNREPGNIHHGAFSIIWCTLSHLVVSQLSNFQTLFTITLLEAPSIFTVMRAQSLVHMQTPTTGTWTTPLFPLQCTPPLPVKF